jgi:hypothetical protein
MQTWSHYAYIVTEGTGDESRGVQIVDLAEPNLPAWVANFDSTFVTAHTIHIADGYAYINGSNDGWRILDLADPSTRAKSDTGTHVTCTIASCAATTRISPTSTIAVSRFSTSPIAPIRRP